MTWSVVGSLGTAVQTASGAALSTLTYGQSPTAGNCLVLSVSGISATAGDNALPAAPSGWTAVHQIAAAGRCTSSVFIKKAAGGDSVPTVAALAATLLAGQLAEFHWSVSGVNFVADQVADAIGTTGTSLTATAGGTDAAAGELLLAVASCEKAAVATQTIAHVFNNGATTVQGGNNNTASSRDHYNFAYGITTGNGTADTDTCAVPGTNADLSLAMASIKAVAPTITDVAEIKLEAPPDGTPTTQTSHKILLHARTASGATDTVLNVELYQGATEITSATLTTTALTSSFALYTLSVLDADAANISDYTNLRFRFWGSSATGDTSTVEVSQAKLQTPDGSGGGAVALAGSSRTSSKTFASLATGSIVALHGTSKTASQSSAEMLVITASMQGASASASHTVGTLTVVPGPKLGGKSKSASRSSAVLSVGSSSINLSGTTRTGSKTTGALSVAVPLVGASRSSSSSTGALVAIVPLGGTSKSASKSQAVLQAPVALSGTSRSASKSVGALKATVALSGSSRSSSRSVATLAVSVIIALHGTSKTGSRSSAVPHVAVPLAGASHTANATSAILGVKQALAVVSRTASATSGTLTHTTPVELGGVSRSGSRSTLTLSVAYPLVASSQTRSKTTGTLSTGVEVIFEIEIALMDSSRSGAALFDLNRTSIAMRDGG